MAETKQQHPHERHTIEAVATAIRQARGLKALAAQILGCSRVTVQQYCKRHPELQQVVQDAKSLTLDLAENKLFERINAGDPWAVCFFLKTQGKHRGYVERRELTGKDGNAVQTQTETMQTLDLTKLSVKQLEALHELLSIAATGDDSDANGDGPRNVTGTNPDNGSTPARQLLPASLH